VPIDTTPTSPVRVEVVHVTAPAAGPPARAEKLAAEPSDGGACARHRLAALNIQITNIIFFIIKAPCFRFFFVVADSAGTNIVESKL
jgi:hypothetical protein